ncbi:MAG: guanylate kinase [Bacteroidetes bacterium]|nr:MAG: guanylate kinase [Bacteroidota bacterium]
MNKVVIFCAPSGSGKTTIVKHLLSNDSRIAFSVSACTRAKRANELDGKDYYFISQDDFKQRIQQGEFLEYEEVYGGNYYGTLKSEIQRIWAMNKAVIFDVDVVGGLNIKNHFGNQALAVFVKPPSVKILEERLRFRSTETEETLQMRLKKALHELSYENKFEHVLLNENLELTLQQAETLVNKFLNQ